MNAFCGFANMKETEAGEFYLDSVGVLPEYRGRGIASRIIDAQCERAASLGHKVAGLIVDIDKPQVEAMYSKLGFTYLDDKDFFGHTMKHMVRPKSMFDEVIERDGKTFRRFSPISAEEAVLRR